MSAADILKIKEKFNKQVRSSNEFRGEFTVTVELDALYDVLKFAKNDLEYDFLLDISSLDHFGEDPRFEMVYELTTIHDTKHLRVKAPVGEEEKVKSIVDLWLAADWHEREVYDMMGIHFENHPNLKRILMWEGYPFYPLRKDFPLAGRPSDMPDVAFTGIAPLEGGPFVTSAGADDTVAREPRAQNQK
jgi:NADH-quinone oxidoreductase subunit C